MPVLQAVASPAYDVGANLRLAGSLLRSTAGRYSSDRWRGIDEEWAWKRRSPIDGPRLVARQMSETTEKCELLSLATGSDVCHRMARESRVVVATKRDVVGTIGNTDVL